MRKLFRKTVPNAAPLLADSEILTVNLDVLSQPAKFTTTSPNALPPGDRLPTTTGKTPGAMEETHAFPPVSVKVIWVIWAELATPSPVSETWIFQSRAVFGPVVLEIAPDNVVVVLGIEYTCLLTPWNESENAPALAVIVRFSNSTVTCWPAANPCTVKFPCAVAAVGLTAKI